jgi:hypothetical protein
MASMYNTRHACGMRLHCRKSGVNQLNTQSLLTELLLSGFFAVAILRAQGMGFQDLRLSPRSLFSLPDRVERLRRSRWQWFSMVLLLVLLRLERGVPIVAELTVLAQFAIFLLLPTQKAVRKAVHAK